MHSLHFLKTVIRRHVVGITA